MTKAHILSLLFTLCISTFFVVKPQAPKEIFVTSGNTFYTISQSDEITHFRLIGVQVPDFSEKPMADNRDVIEAKALLKRLMMGKGLYYEYDEQLYDKYGRDLVYLTTSDSIKVNQELIKSRFATHIIQPPNTRYSDLFSKLDSEGAD